MPNPKPKNKFPFGAMNPRQLERKRMLDDMFDCACRIQRALIEEKGDEFNGIPIDEFLASFRIRNGVREFTSKQYFKDFETTKRFTRTSGKFKVAEKYYKEWLAEEERLEKELGDQLEAEEEKL